MVKKAEKCQKTLKKRVFSPRGVYHVTKIQFFLYFLKLPCIAEPMQVTKSPYLSYFVFYDFLKKKIFHFPYVLIQIREQWLRGGSKKCRRFFL